MEHIHGFDEDAYYYCPNKECVCNQKDEVTRYSEHMNIPRQIVVINGGEAYILDEYDEQTEFEEYEASFVVKPEDEEEDNIS